jgi:hypothetical protein
MKSGMLVAVAAVLGLAMGVVLKHSPRPKPVVVPAPTVDAPKEDLSSRPSSGSLLDEMQPPPEENLVEPLPEISDQPEPAARTSAPRDPVVVEKLTKKYSTSSPEEMRAAFDSLSEVLDAQRHMRMANKDAALNRTQMKALEDELGWLSDHSKH